MKMLVTVAVYGLVPVPPMPDMMNNRRGDLRTTSEAFDFSQFVILPGPLTERVATMDELARIRYELEKIAAIQAG